jgi:hypothetical protein
MAIEIPDQHSTLVIPNVVEFSLKNWKNAKFRVVGTFNQKTVHRQFTVNNLPQGKFEGSKRVLYLFEVTFGTLCVSLFGQFLI